MATSTPGRLALAAIALGTLVAFDARAVGFGPFPLISPSEIVNQDASIQIQPTGSISFDIATVPFSTPQEFALTDVSIDAGNFHFTLDPTLATPALGVVQPDGHFLIPTLFLVGNDGTNDFDLAIPNVIGALIGAPGPPQGLFSQFQIETDSDLFDVSIYAAVPEPGTVSLLLLGCASLALRRRVEIAR